MVRTVREAHRVADEAGGDGSGHVTCVVGAGGFTQGLPHGEYNLGEDKLGEDNLHEYERTGASLDHPRHRSRSVTPARPRPPRPP